jgi:hypothetical protein
MKTPFSLKKTNRILSNSSKKYRYPGSRPFEADEKDLFFGRSDDSQKLYQQILNEKTVLLYAKSGLGKSSLINAGLLPLLLQVPHYDIIQVRFGNFNAQLDHYESPLEKLTSQITYVNNPETRYLEKIIPNENSLWYRVKQSQRLDQDRTLLFIFDQFEELLTHPAEDIFYFKKQFANLLFADVPANIRSVLDRKLDRDPDLLTKMELQLLTAPMRTKTLFAIRSDRMSELNQIADYFPNILKTFYELKPLNRKQAEEAITAPARSVSGGFASMPFTFQPHVVEKVIHSLEDDVTHSIESFQLQMVCRYAEDLVVQGKTINAGEISEEDLGDIQSIFAENYRRILSELPSAYQYHVQVLIEEKLIVGGNRVPLPELVILQQLSIPQTVINTLLDSHFLRAEINSTGGRSIELSHDTLIAPVTEALEKRKTEEKARLEKEQTEAAAAEQQQQLEAAKRLAEAERQRAEEQASLRKDAEMAKDIARRNLWYAGLVAIVALVVAIIAVLNYRRAEEAKASANFLYNQVKKEQAVSKANELKSFGDSYWDLHQFEFAKQNYQAAFDSVRPYPDLPVYQELESKLKDKKR